MKKNELFEIYDKNVKRFKEDGLLPSTFEIRAFLKGFALGYDDENTIILWDINGKAYRASEPNEGEFCVGVSIADGIPSLVDYYVLSKYDVLNILEVSAVFSAE